MPITDQFTRLAISEITIQRDARHRREISTVGLVDSVRQHGVLQPIIVRRTVSETTGESLLLLVAGERRIAASLEAGLTTIPVRFAEDLSPVEAQIFELEENIKRTDLCWQDLARAVGEIHTLFLGLNPDWTQAETAEACNLQQPVISIYLKVWGKMDDPRIVEASTVREAYNLLGRRDARAAGEVLQELLEAGPSAGAAAAPAATSPLMPPTSSISSLLSPGSTFARVIPTPALRWPDARETILHEDFRQWAPRYTGRKFNLVHCDFPYGVNVFDGGQGSRAADSKYSDTKDIYFALIETFCTHLDKFMSVSGHLMFWYSMNWHRETLDLFRQLAPSIDWLPHPLIWIKSDNSGIVSDTRRRPRHIYETCLMGSRGARQIVKVVSDAYSSPTDKRFHVSTKPEPMLKHFMSMFVDENTQLLDPTVGSGAALRAAEELGAGRVLGMDVDESIVGTARMALRNARSLRSANREFV